MIGSASLCTLYKGTLSSGVEIAVASIAVASAKDWSNSMEAQFRKKVPLYTVACKFRVDIYMHIHIYI